MRSWALITNMLSLLALSWADTNLVGQESIGVPSIAVENAAPSQHWDSKGNERIDLDNIPAEKVLDSSNGGYPESLIPNDFVPWWQPASLAPLRPAPTHLAIDVNSLVVDSLRYSAQVRAISDNVVIAQSNITRANAEFDVRTFMESKLLRTSVPTGSTLEAGFNVPRLREADWYYNAGIRQKNRLGGRLEAAQRVGSHNSNSQFFFPANQGNSRLTLSYNQPLLNGAGRPYNNSLVVLAQFDTEIALYRSAGELQDHLLAVIEAMWELYQQRTVLLQKQRHFERAQTILQRLEHRQEIDSLDSQIARARAAVSMRSAELIRAATEIRNEEAHIRALVNSPTMLTDRQLELVPKESPLVHFVPISIESAGLMALENHPGINASLQEIEAARVRFNVATNELKPVLDAVVETYVSGLRGRYDIGGSLADQFSVGAPSYAMGLVYEMPFRNRAAKANFQRRQVELRQLQSRLQASIQTLHADVEVAVREIETTYRELQAKYVSLTAAMSDVQYMQRRWEDLPGDDRASSFLLTDLLDAQDRLVFEEMGFSRAQVDYALSLTRLNRATGMMLQFEQIQLIRSTDDRVPSIHYDKNGSGTEFLPPLPAQ